MAMVPPSGAGDDPPPPHDKLFKFGKWCLGSPVVKRRKNKPGSQTQGAENKGRKTRNLFSCFRPKAKDELAENPLLDRGGRLDRTDLNRMGIDTQCLRTGRLEESDASRIVATFGDRLSCNEPGSLHTGSTRVWGGTFHGGVPARLYHRDNERSTQVGHSSASTSRTVYERENSFTQDAPPGALPSRLFLENMGGFSQVRLFTASSSRTYFERGESSTQARPSPLALSRTHDENGEGSTQEMQSNPSSSQATQHDERSSQARHSPLTSLEHDRLLPQSISRSSSLDIERDKIQK